MKRLILAIALLSSATLDAKAQTAKDLIGTWSLVSITVQQPDNGPTTNDLGPNPQGRLNFDADGNYSLMVMAGDLPKFAANSRDNGTPAENQAVVKNSISHFGHYSVNDGDIDFKIDYSTFPNWNGTEQQRHFTISGDKLSYYFMPPTSKVMVRLVWQHTK
jgi:Lipocalin-like domain